MKKTIKKRAFISAIAMLIVSAIVLTSSTFAWFSMAKSVDVETMQLNITSPEGIQISANTSAFTTKLNIQDFDPQGDYTSRFMVDRSVTTMNHVPEELSPSSCAFFVQTGQLPTFYSGSINSEGKASVTKATDGTGKYVVFDLFVKLGSATEVYWGDSTITCKDNKDVPTAMRIAMVNCGSGEKGTVEQTTSYITYYGVDNGNKVNSIVVYEPDGRNHTESAIAAGATAGVAYTTRPVHTGYSGVTPVSKTSIIDNDSFTDTLKCKNYNETAKDSVFFKGAVGINRIRVYIWMEGQDIDCANDVAGSQIEVNLNLNIH